MQETMTIDEALAIMSVAKDGDENLEKVQEAKKIMGKYVLWKACEKVA